MKRITLILTIFLFGIISLFAQSEHLKFMGIPITSTPVRFEQKLKAKGFKFLEKKKDQYNNNIRVYVGNFARNRVKVEVLSKRNITWRVSVIFPEKKFGYLKSDYYDLRRQIIRKYGDPADEYDYEDPTLELYEDIYDIYASNLERCTYFAQWNKRLGNIVLFLNKETDRLHLIYEDSKSTDLIDRLENKDIQDDI